MALNPSDSSSLDQLALKGLMYALKKSSLFSILHDINI